MSNNFSRFEMYSQQSCADYVTVGQISSGHVLFLPPDPVVLIDVLRKTFSKLDQFQTLFCHHKFLPPLDATHIVNVAVDARVTPPKL